MSRVTHRLVAADSAPTPARQGLELGLAAADLYADLRLAPMLRRLLAHSNRLLGAVAGSISMLDASRQRYSKMAEHGVACELGRSFPLDEGLTGQVVARREPVVLRRYSTVPGGHLPAGHPARHGAAVAVPLWWRGEVVGANVVFAGRDRRFTMQEIEELELLTQVCAAGIVKAAEGDPSLSALLRGQGRTVASDSGRPTHFVTPAGDPSGPAVGPAQALPSPFTPRERETAGLLALGFTDRELAAHLVLSHKTVEKHVGAVLRKTGTANRTAAVMAALARGWLPAT